MRLIREALGVSAQDLAERAGMSPTLLSFIESGKRSPSEEVSKRLATALGVPKDALLGLGAEVDRKPRGVAARIERVMDDLEWITQQIREKA